MSSFAKCAGAALLLGLSGCSTSGGKPVIRVGSKNFTEQVVLGEIIAQHLENRLHQKVERSLNLGGTLLAQQSLVGRQIDLYPEYTGTALTVVLKDAIEKDPARVLAKVRAGYLQKFHAEWLDPLGIDNTFAMVVRGPEARAEHLETLTDAAKSAQPWMLGVGYEFEQRADGLAALDQTYHLRWSNAPKTMDLGLLYKAMEQGQVSMIAANATDGLLSKMDLKILRDDRKAFPPYQVCIVARQDTMREIPGMRDALAELSAKFNNQLMQKLNFAVDAEHRPVGQVAAEFLKQAGLQ
jgi:osmoprotectant transport system substrate-binding protein